MLAIFYIQCFVIFLILCAYFPKLHHYSGVRLIVEKIFPPSNAVLNADDYVKPSSFVPWAISIYFVFFGVVSTRYNTQLENIKTKVSIFQAQMATEMRSESCAGIAHIQHSRIPIKPNILTPISTVKSLFFQEESKEINEIILQTIYGYKQHLDNSRFEYSNLSNAELDSAKMRNATLSYTEFKGTNFKNTDLSHAYFIGSNLTRAYFNDSNLEKTKFYCCTLNNVDFREANLKSTSFTASSLAGAIFRNLTLEEHVSIRLEHFFLPSPESYFNHDIQVTASQLSEAETLYKALLPAKIERELKQTHPHLFEKPNWHEED